MFIAALFTIAKTWKQTKCPLTGRDKDDVVDVYIMKHYLDIKKNKIMPFTATWMDLEIIILSEKVRDDFSHMWSLILKSYTNALFYKMKINTDIENKLMVTKWEMSEVGG